MQQCANCQEFFDRKITKPPKTCSEECKRAINRKRVREYYVAHWGLRQKQQFAYKQRVKERFLSRGLPCPCPSCNPVQTDCT